MAENTKVSTIDPNGLTFATYITSPSIQKGIEETIGKNNLTKFVSSIMSAVQTTPQLKKCTNTSILSGALLGESLNLPPSPQLGYYYLVPYKNKGTDEAQFQIGWKGLVQLAIRSGQYRRIVVNSVKEGEIIQNPITEEFEINPITDPSKRESAKTVGYYAMFELMNGFKKELYWTLPKMEAHAKKYSSGYRSDIKNKTSYTNWTSDFDNMAKKTMIRQLLSKWGIMSIEMQKAFEADQSVVREDGSYDYVDNIETPEEVIDTVATEIKENQNQIPFDAD